MKQRVTGIGGVFFRFKDPEKMKAWYKQYLGLETDAHGWTFKWENDTQPAGLTQLGFFSSDTDYFKPSESSWMLNFRVADLDGLLAVLREEGVAVVGEPQEYDYGKFGWILDPEGNKIELWQPLKEF